MDDKALESDWPVHRSNYLNIFFRLQSVMDKTAQENENIPQMDDMFIYRPATITCHCH